MRPNPRPTKKALTFYLSHRAILCSTSRTLEVFRNLAATPSSQLHFAFCECNLVSPIAPIDPYHFIVTLRLPSAVILRTQTRKAYTRYRPRLETVTGVVAFVKLGPSQHRQRQPTNRRHLTQVLGSERVLLQPELAGAPGLRSKGNMMHEEAPAVPK